MNCKKIGEKVIGSKLIDSSVWIKYLFEGSCKEIIELEEQNYLSLLSLFEIKLKLIKKEIEKEEIKSNLEFIKQKNIILELNEKIAEEAAEISLKNKIPAIDSLIYSTAIENQLTLITLDNDFRGLNNAVVLNN